MSQMMLNNYQACWLIQLTSYDFTIQYCQDNLNSADESLWKSDWLQTILNCIKKLAILIKKLSFWVFSLVLKLSFWTFSSVLKLSFQTFSLVLKLCFWAFLSKRSLFSIWLKMLKNLICCANRYLINSVKNWKETSHLLWSEMKFWEKWIIFLCFSRKLFKSDS